MSLRPTTPPAFISFPKPLIVATFYFQWLVCILQISTWRQVFLYVYMSSTIVQFSCAQLFQTNKQLVWLFIFLNFICQQKNRHFLLLETHFKLKTQSPSRVRSLFLPLSVIPALSCQCVLIVFNLTLNISFKPRNVTFLFCPLSCLLYLLYCRPLSCRLFGNLCPHTSTHFFSESDFERRMLVSLLYH